MFSLVVTDWKRKKEPADNIRELVEVEKSHKLVI